MENLRSSIRISLYRAILFASLAVLAAQNTSEAQGSNLRWATDLATRGVQDLENESSSAQHVIGFDLHKVFTSSSGDIGTLILQPYIVKLHNVANPPFFFDGEDQELTWRITNFNLTKLSKGQFNIRLGHFEVPFGLEQNINTNGTLRQLTFASRRIKADWGISANGSLTAFDYEVAATRGSGNDLSADQDPGLISGRIGTPSNRNLITGISFLQGDVLTGNGIVDTDQIGIDLAYYLYSWELLFELSTGDRGPDDIVNSFIEASWYNNIGSIHAYFQLRNELNKNTSTGRQDTNSMTTGLSWSITPSLTLSSQWTKELDNPQTSQEASRFFLQARIRL